MISSRILDKISNFFLGTVNSKVNSYLDFYGETLWLNRKIVTELSQKYRIVISKQLKKIFEEGESDEQVVCAKFAYTTQKNQIFCYNQRVINAVGYCVIQDKHYISDFDEEVRKLIGKNTGGNNDEI